MPMSQITVKFKLATHYTKNLIPPGGVLGRVPRMMHNKHNGCKKNENAIPFCFENVKMFHINYYILRQQYLPVQNFLHGITFWVTLRPHWEHNIHSKSLIGPNFTSNL